MRDMIVIAAALMLATGARAQEAQSAMMAGGITVHKSYTLGDFKPADGTFTGSLDMSASPCGDSNFKTSVKYPGVKSLVELRARAANDSCRILGSVALAARQCAQ